MKPKKIKRNAKLFNVRLDTDLLLRANNARVAFSYTWPDLIEYLLTQWLDSIPKRVTSKEKQ